MTLRIVTLATIMTLQLGCAFHPSEAELANGEPAPQEALPTALVRVAWWTDEQSRSPLLTRTLEINRQTRVMKATSAITLPAQVPDRVEVELSYPTSLAELQPNGVSIQAARESERPVAILPKKIIIASRTADLTVAIIELPEMRRFFSDNREGNTQIRFMLQQTSGETPLTAVFELRTPPSLVQLSQGAPSESDFQDYRAGDALKRFELGGSRYELLHVSRIKNLSAQALRIEVPVRVESVLRANRRTYSATANGLCGNSSSTLDHKDDLTRDIKLLILSDDLPKLVLAMSGDASAAASTAATVETDKEVRIGIYGTGSEVSALTEGKYQEKKPGMVQVPQRCESKCPKIRMGASEFPLCWDTVRRRTPAKYPNDQIARCNECFSGVQASCESCRIWEDTTLGYNWAGPNCLFCGELAEVGNVEGVPILRAVPQWRTEQVMGAMPSGEEDRGFILESNPASAPMTVRYADVPENDDPQGRVVRFLSSVQSFRSEQ